MKTCMSWPAKCPNSSIWPLTARIAFGARTVPFGVRAAQRLPSRCRPTTGEFSKMSAAGRARRQASGCSLPAGSCRPRAYAGRPSSRSVPVSSFIGRGVEQFERLAHAGQRAREIGVEPSRLVRSRRRSSCRTDRTSTVGMPSSAAARGRECDRETVVCNLLLGLRGIAGRILTGRQVVRQVDHEAGIAARPGPPRPRGRRAPRSSRRAAAASAGAPPTVPRNRRR